MRRRDYVITRPLRGPPRRLPTGGALLYGRVCSRVVSCCTGVFFARCTGVFFARCTGVFFAVRVLYGCVPVHARVLYGVLTDASVQLWTEADHHALNGRVHTHTTSCQSRCELRPDFDSAGDLALSTRLNFAQGTRALFFFRSVLPQFVVCCHEPLSLFVLLLCCREAALADSRSDCMPVLFVR